MKNGVSPSNFTQSYTYSVLVIFLKIGGCKGGSFYLKIIHAMEDDTYITERLLVDLNKNCINGFNIFGLKLII
jgi:hypothetical protein